MTACEWIVPASKDSPRHRCTEAVTWERTGPGVSLCLCDAHKAELFDGYNNLFQMTEEQHYRRVE
jgi:hypothetical protein